MDYAEYSVCGPWQDLQTLFLQTIVHAFSVALWYFQFILTLLVPQNHCLNKEDNKHSVFKKFAVAACIQSSVLVLFCALVFSDYLNFIVLCFIQPADGRIVLFLTDTLKVNYI